MRAKLVGTLLLATSLCFGAAPIASAADMPAKAPVLKAPATVATSWTGFYVNGGIGYGMWAADTTTVNPITGACRLCTTQVQGGKGWLAKIGVGYDYQFSPKFVAGVFGDFDISSLKGTIQDQDPFFAGEIKQTSAWALGARAGWLVTPETLTYVNGGYAGARFSGANLVSTFDGTGSGNSTPAFTANGWFIGGGAESMLAPNWYWRNEYRLANYGSKTLSDTGALGTGSSITFKPTVQTVTTQLVYKFNGGLAAPVYQTPAPVATNWTGFYVNAGYGYGIWNADTTILDPATGLCILCVTQVQGGKGYLGVIGVGYDRQFAPAWVYGVFADFDISSLKGTIQDQGPYLAGDIKQTSAWAVGARLGWLPSAQTMTYANGGYTRARFSGATMVPEVVGFPTDATTSGFTTSGWFLGGGVETTFDFFGMLGKGWFWRNEYRYARYASRTVAETSPTFGPISDITFKPTVQTVTSQLVFKFNGPR
ncbi:MAG: porin family protein [Rhizobiales bacterium]|nr:porin family protein [Hyphomicrobiales bacterium]